MTLGLEWIPQLRHAQEHALECRLYFKPREQFTQVYVRKVTLLHVTFVFFDEHPYEEDEAKYKFTVTLPLRNLTGITIIEPLKVDVV